MKPTYKQRLKLTTMLHDRTIDPYVLNDCDDDLLNNIKKAMIADDWDAVALILDNEF